MSSIFLLLNLVFSDESFLPSKPEGSYVHFQSFNDPNWNEKWITSGLSNVSGKWEVEESAEPQSVPGEKLLLMKTAMAYYGVSTKFDKPLILKGKTLVLQYEVRFQEALECGGSYIKLFSNENFDPAILSNETRYSIMFGPDKCGSTNKVHFIFRHKNPITGVIEEKHMKDAPTIKTDKINHLYTLIVRPDNSFEVLIDAESVKQGNLLTDFAPAVNPPKEIDDPNDHKPSDWVDDETIPDPEAVKPEDWDENEPEFIPDPEKLNAPEGWLVNEPKFIPDSEAKKPEDWDDDIHGDWEAPTIPNPKCEKAPGCGEYEAPLIKNDKFKGKWKAPMIKNPAFKGIWKPKQIPNPNYFEDKEPHNFMPIAGAGFELWMVNKEIGFTNIFIGHDESVVHKWNKDHFLAKHDSQVAQQKKLEPQESASAGKGLTSSLGDFGDKIKTAYLELYNEYPTVIIAATVIAVAIPLIIMVLVCCKSKPEPLPQPPVHKPKVEEVPNETETKSDEKPNKEGDSIEKRTTTTKPKEE